MFVIPLENPLSVLTPRQTEAIGHRLDAPPGQTVPYSDIACRMGISSPAVHKLIGRGLRRLDQQRVPTEHLRHRLAS